MKNNNDMTNAAICLAFLLVCFLGFVAGWKLATLAMERQAVANKVGSYVRVESVNEFVWGGGRDR